MPTTIEGANGIDKLNPNTPLFGAVAWINYDGNADSKRAGGNLTVTKNATGDYSAAFDNPLPNANYAVVAMVRVNSSTNFFKMITCTIKQGTTPTINGFDFETGTGDDNNSSYTNRDCDYIMLAVFN
jgi:hypothetical protein